jgi:hypothetical protein
LSDLARFGLLAAFFRVGGGVGGSGAVGERVGCRFGLSAADSDAAQEKTKMKA